MYEYDPICKQLLADKNVKTNRFTSGLIERETIWGVLNNMLYL